MTPRPTVTAIGYARRSHESNERTVSLLAQKTEITAYAKAQGWTLAAIVEHDGISGGKRSRFGVIDAALKLHQAKTLIVYSMDRAGRDVVGLLSWLERAQRAGVQLHACDKGLIEIGTASGFLGTTVEAMVSQHYKIICSEKTKTALRHLRLSGRRWANVAPYGQRWTQDGGVEPDPAEQVIVTRARALRAEGLSLRAISATLAGKGTLARSGRPLSAETLNAILHRPS